MNQTHLEEELAALKRALAEPPLKLAAAGGGMRAETGDAFEVVFDGVVLIPRRRVQRLVELLAAVQLAPADAPHTVETTP